MIAPWLLIASRASVAIQAPVASRITGTIRDVQANPIPGEVFFMGVVPVIVALGALALSLHSMLRAPGFLQRLLGGSTLVMTLGSLWILIWMFVRDTWPSALPHLVIALTAVIAVIQWRLAVRSSRAVQRTSARP